MQKNLLSIQHLEVSVNQVQIVKNINLDIKSGKIHVIMGPNGSGKSSLLLGISGHPSYQSHGKIFLNRQDLSTLTPEQRVKMGLMLTFQNPIGIPGVTVRNLLKTAFRELNHKQQLNLTGFYENLNQAAQNLNISPSLLNRSLNVDFSGGEKKLMEILCVEILKPKFILFDEIDTGLDIDALKKIASQIIKLQKNGSGILLVTHYHRLVKLLSFQKIYVMKKGRIIISGKNKLLQRIINNGYESM